jgi:hypothetical protein
MRLFLRQCIAFYLFGNADTTTGLSTPINSRISSSAAAKANLLMKEHNNAPYYRCLLSDLPTPSLVLDLMAIDKIMGRGPTFTDANSIPPFRIRDWILYPTSTGDSHPEQHNPPDDEVTTTRSTATTTTGTTNTRLLLGNLDELTVRHGTETKGLLDVCFGYIHAKVLEPRHREGLYLAKLDLPTGTTTTTNTTTVDAHLVLGLNNHHVGSYYWARSAGGGAAMEAPGIALRGGNRLEWESSSISSSFTDCNSNDGKRSEWVNFLTVDDQVQLRPHNLDASISLFRDNVYGISSAGRPLGAEPMVLCRFDVEHVSTSES